MSTRARWARLHELRGGVPQHRRRDTRASEHHGRERENPHRERQPREVGDEHEREHEGARPDRYRGDVRADLQSRGFGLNTMAAIG